MENQNSKKGQMEIAPELLDKMDAYWRVSIGVRDPHETKRIIETINACLKN